MADGARERALLDYRRALIAAREKEAALETAKTKLRASRKAYDKTEDDMKALQVSCDSIL